MASKDSNGKSRGSGRTRNFSTVVYPESAPEGWIQTLQESFVPAFISPCHDSDLNADNTPKKAHYHVMLMFDSVKTKEQASALFSKIGGVGCEVVQSVRGYARYLCHLDNPEKHQYDIGKVQCLSGADYQSIINLVTDKYKAVREIMAFCKANGIYEFADLMDYAAENREDWFRILCDSGAYIVKNYLQSLYLKHAKSLNHS